MTHLSPTRAERKTATAERILVAAREEFGLKGFSRTTIRGIAVKAGVNSSLVHQYYGSKDLLFTEALGLGAGSHETAATHLGDVVAMKLGELSPETLALLRSMLTSTEASQEISAYMDQRIDALALSIGGTDAYARAIVAASSTFGLTILRHFLMVPSVVNTDSTELMATARRWFEDLTGPRV